MLFILHDTKKLSKQNFIADSSLCALPWLGLGERRIMLGTIAEPRKRRSMVGESENKLRVEEDRVNLRKRLFPALG